MSRFYEGDGFDDEEQEREFNAELAAAYVRDRELLVGFLAHLDAMPRKRIIVNRYYNKKTGDACAVGEFCRYRGETVDGLRETERESARDREDEGVEGSGGWFGPTMEAGQHFGLSEHTAHNLGWLNDIVWVRVEHYCKIACTCKRGIDRPHHHTFGRWMTPEERWLKLRNHIALNIGEPLITAVA